MEDITIMTTTTPGTARQTTVRVPSHCLAWGSYGLYAGGHFLWRGDLPAGTAPSVIALVENPALRDPVDYDAAGARLAAGFLLGYAHQRLHPGTPVPQTITTTPLPPTRRTATSTIWPLGWGLVLRHDVPFGARLDTGDTDKWPLTAMLATTWARALLGLTAELEHGQALAARAMQAERTGRTTTGKLWTFLDRVRGQLTVDQTELADRMREVLAEHDSTDLVDLAACAIDVANPDLPTSVAEARLLDRHTVGHLGAAAVIDELADRYAIPISYLTAKSVYVWRDLPPGVSLTEEQWLRLGRTDEMGSYSSFIENELDNNRDALDTRLALYQAGLMCRGEADNSGLVCDELLTEDIAVTLGRCVRHRPPTIALALEAGCPGAPDVRENFVSHFPTSHGACDRCGLPLPDDYRLRIEAEEAAGQARRQVEADARQVSPLAVERQAGDVD